MEEDEGQAGVDEKIVYNESYRRFKRIIPWNHELGKTLAHRLSKWFDSMSPQQLSLLNELMCDAQSNAFLDADSFEKDEIVLAYARMGNLLKYIRWLVISFDTSNGLPRNVFKGTHNLIHLVLGKKRATLFAKNLQHLQSGKFKSNIKGSTLWRKLLNGDAKKPAKKSPKKARKKAIKRTAEKGIAKKKRGRPKKK